MVAAHCECTLKVTTSFFFKTVVFRLCDFILIEKTRRVGRSSTHFNPNTGEAEVGGAL